MDTTAAAWDRFQKGLVKVLSKVNATYIVSTLLDNSNSVGEGLVRGFDIQRPGFEVQDVLLDEVDVVDTNHLNNENNILWGFPFIKITFKVSGLMLSLWIRFHAWYKYSISKTELSSLDSVNNKKQ